MVDDVSEAAGRGAVEVSVGRVGCNGHESTAELVDGPLAAQAHQVHALDRVPTMRGGGLLGCVYFVRLLSIEQSSRAVYGRCSAGAPGPFDG
jgi:hypothetical protein